MRRAVLFLALVALVCHSEARILLAQRSFSQSKAYLASIPGKDTFHLGGPAHESHPVKFSILLRQSNLGKLEEHFRAVSDPQSPRWRQFLTKEQVDNLVSPGLAAVGGVTHWLHEHGVQLADYQVHGDTIHIQTTAGKAARLFQTTFHTLHHPRGGVQALAVGAVSIPDELGRSVHFVTGLSELFLKTRLSARSGDDDEENPLSEVPTSLKGGYSVPDGNRQFITPSVLRTYYNIPQSEANQAKENRQAILAFNDMFRMKALCEFHSTFANITAQEISSTVSIGGSPIAFGESESDLDMQYLTAVGQGTNSLFINHDEGRWVLDGLLTLSSMATPPNVASISYGFPELWMCTVVNCTTLGYTVDSYISRFDTEAQKLGTRGVSLIVASGDSGAPGDSNCQLDPARTSCPFNDNPAQVNLTCSCTAIAVDDGTPDHLCILPMGSSNPNCTMVKKKPPTDCFQVAHGVSQILANGNWTAPDGTIHKSAHGCVGGVTWDQVWSNCTCPQLPVIKVGNCTSRGWDYNRAQAGTSLQALFPASSPWVTSVGATMLSGPEQCGASSIVYSEAPASTATGSLITTGGGFSAFHAQPSYQSDAVQAYLKSGVKMAQSDYNPRNRGFPDVALLGHEYLVVRARKPPSTKCCQVVSVDGTSAAAPAFAGIVALINGKLLQQKQAPLGFLNPLLYKAAANNSGVFRRVAQGDNSCSRQTFCCMNGFSVSPKTLWDPVVGLGSVNYLRLLAYLNLEPTPVDNPFLIYWVLLSSLGFLVVVLSIATFWALRRYHQVSSQDVPYHHLSQQMDALPQARR